ncbi:MAG: electron transfer flavoprotein subunit beta [Bacillota bacterium]|nr:MAG: electron transfer flavoprotein subunit beta [Bacillota bacterium]
MHVVVCLKQVPDSSEMRINPKTGTLVRQGVTSIINPYDVHALEAALQIKDQFGGEVTVVSMGPPFFEQSLKEAVAVGADRTILVSDRAMAGADTFATSRVLAEAIRRIEREFGPVDLICCGRQTIDGDTGQVGPGIAARLDIPVLTYVIRIREVNPQGRYIVVERKVEGGRQVVRSTLPALLTVEKELNELRYASLPGMLRAARHKPIVWNRETLGLDRTEVGLLGSPTIVAKSFTPPERKRNTVMIDGSDPRRAARELADRLLAHPTFRKAVLESRRAAAMAAAMAQGAGGAAGSSGDR